VVCIGQDSIARWISASSKSWKNIRSKVRVCPRLSFVQLRNVFLLLRCWNLGFLKLASDNLYMLYYIIISSVSSSFCVSSLSQSETVLTIASRGGHWPYPLQNEEFRGSRSKQISDPEAMCLLLFFDPCKEPDPAIQRPSDPTGGAFPCGTKTWVVYPPS